MASCPWFASSTAGRGAARRRAPETLEARLRIAASDLRRSICLRQCASTDARFGRLRCLALSGPWRAHARPPELRRLRGVIGKRCGQSRDAGNLGHGRIPCCRGPALRVGPLRVERADVALAFAPLEVLRDGRDWDDFADERGLVPVSLRDAIRIPRQDWIADSEGEVSRTGLRLAIGRTHHYQGCASYIRSPNSSCIRRRVRTDWSTAAEVRTGPRNTFRTSWGIVLMDVTRTFFQRS